jgi:hypothetical protein
MVLNSSSETSFSFRSPGGRRYHPGVVSVVRGNHLASATNKHFVQKKNPWRWAVSCYDFRVESKLVAGFPPLAQVDDATWEVGRTLRQPLPPWVVLEGLPNFLPVLTWENPQRSCECSLKQNPFQGQLSEREPLTSGVSTTV